MKEWRTHTRGPPKIEELDWRLPNTQKKGLDLLVVEAKPTTRAMRSELGPEPLMTDQRHWANVLGGAREREGSSFYTTNPTRRPW